jgi:O-antigen ligase
MTRQFIQAALQSRDPQMLPGIPIDTGVLHRLESTRIFSTFLHPNTYALFLAMAGALTMGWLWSMYDPLKRFAKSSMELPLATRVAGLLVLLLFAASSVLIPWNLWLTQSRGGFLSAIVIVALFAAIGVGARRSASNSAIVVAGAALVLFLMLGPVEAVPVDKLIVRETSFFSRLKDTLTVTQRFSYWKATLNMVQDNPWLGIGWGAFEKAYPRYMIQGGYPTRLAHNNYLQIWAETGILGLNAFVGLWMVFLYTFWQKWRGASCGMRGIICGLGAAIIGFLVNSLIDFSLYEPTLAYIVFALLGLLVAIPSERDDKFSIPFPAAPAALLIGLLCLLLVPLGRSYAATHLYARADKIRNSAFPNQFALRRGFKTDPETQLQALGESVTLLERAAKYFPLDSDTHRMLGDSYLRLSHMTRSPSFLDKSITELRRAIHLSPLSPYAHHSLAMAYWARANATGQTRYYDKAIEAERQASANFPVNPEFHEQLAQIYTNLGFEEQANQETSVAAELRKHYREY